MFYNLFSVIPFCSPCLSRGWFDQVPAAAAAAAAGPCWGGVACCDCPVPGPASAPPPGLAPQPRNPGAAGDPLLVPELATVVGPGATVAGKEVGVGKPPWSPGCVPGGPGAPPCPGPPPRFPMSPQPAWLRAAATRAGLMGSAPSPIPAIPAMGPLPDWPPPEKAEKETLVSIFRQNWKISFVTQLFYTEG